MKSFPRIHVIQESSISTKETNRKPFTAISNTFSFGSVTLNVAMAVVVLFNNMIENY